MANGKRKAKEGGPRTEVFALRLDPKLKYLAEIAARKQRRSLANFVEWAIERALTQVHLVDPDLNDNVETIADATGKLWALDEPDRLVQLAEYFPELLSYDEQLIWRVICEHDVYNQSSNRISSFRDGKGIATSLVRDCWPQIKAYALGTGSKDELNEVLLHNDDIPF